MADQTARTVADAMLKEVFCKHGVPEVIISDQGRQFTSEVFNMAKLMGFQHIFTCAYHPSSNGQVERANRTIADIISQFVNKRGTNWDEVLHVRV